MVAAEMGMSRPLISVVVPTWNTASVLPQALRSLSEQTFVDFEVIVSDGASSDGTLGVAEKFAGALAHLQIDSRPDTGVYDAINRGVRLSSGQWFMVLGSDDRLHSRDTLAAVAQELLAAGPVQMVYGDVCMMAPNRSGIPPGGRFAGPMPLSRLFSSNICQQSVFYRRKLFDRLGGFNERYRLYADWDFNIRAAFEAPTQWIDLVVADYAATGMSASAVDQSFIDDMHELILREFMRRSGQRTLWPLQRRVRHDANVLRKRGQWGLALSHLASYLHLLVLRVPNLLKGGA
ncbi:MAG: glycosyltransferase [Rhizobacter sp.]|nr:glycosyltransferase [Rhizobacter sp.]